MAGATKASRTTYRAQEFHTPYGVEGWEDAAVDMLRREGLAVITGVFDTDFCDAVCNRVGDALEAMCPGLDLDHPDKTFTPELLPPQTRSGLFQCLLGNLPVTWQVRSHPRIRQVFTAVYSALRGRPITDFTVGVDGVNFRPPIKFSTPTSPDWAHLDQTHDDNKYRCVQGQFVASASTACFRASPRSHHCFAKLLKMANRYKAKGDWCKFNAEQVVQAQRIIEESGGEWQVPIEAPRGSIILWLSATVHSARGQILGLAPPADEPSHAPKATFTGEVKEVPETDAPATDSAAAATGPGAGAGGGAAAPAATPAGAGGAGAGAGAGAAGTTPAAAATAASATTTTAVATVSNGRKGKGRGRKGKKGAKQPRDWRNWRCVIYVCWRPKADQDPAQLRKHCGRLQTCFKENRCTNHWGSRMFGKKGSTGRFSRYDAKSSTLKAIVEDPKRMFEVVTATGERLRPEATPEVLHLIGKDSSGAAGPMDAFVGRKGKAKATGAKRGAEADEPEAAAAPPKRRRRKGKGRVQGGAFTK